MMKKERIQKVLARLGVASRREVERMISDGVIKVNNKLATLGQPIDGTDKVFVKGKRIKLNVDQPTRFLIYNKPEGEIVTRQDPDGRPSVFDSLPRLHTGRWINIGRLDFNTSGLLLFTNNGDYAHRLMHPSKHLEREYAVRVFGQVTPEVIQRLVNGVKLEDGLSRFEDVVAADTKGSNRWFNVVIMQGKNRIVRRLWESQDCQVSRLKRLRFGPITMPRGLLVGRFTELTGLIKTQLVELCEQGTTDK